jgi:CRISPR-associated endonuclease/helicase Cas3
MDEAAMRGELAQPPSPRLLALWAKSGDPPHTLLGHLLDTAAVSVEILEREPPSTRALYESDLGLSQSEAVRWAAFLAALHDLGKATPVFQAAWARGLQGVRAAGLEVSCRVPTSPKEPLWVAHGVLTELLVRKLLEQMGLARAFGKRVARGLGSHHGFPATADELAKADIGHLRGTGDWEAVRGELVAWLWRALGVSQVPPVKNLSGAGTMRIMALAAVADWIASDARFFPYEREPVDPPGYFSEGLSLARSGLDQIGWHRRLPLGGQGLAFEDVFPFAPNTVQDVVAKSLNCIGQPLLLLLEAPAGAGKTEAALFAHLELSRQVGHRGLYVALPTQATGNGIFPRVRDFLRRVGGRAMDLQLQHGTAWLSPEFVELQPRNVGEPSDSEAEGEVLARAWFTRRKRGMLTEYGVGTLDQALLGVLRVKHHFVRLWGLANRTVVLDEVHAYDAYTSGLLEALLRWLRHSGSSVLLMSATLPRSRRQRLLRAFGADPPADDGAYPRLVVAREHGCQVVSIPWPRSQTYALEAAPRDTQELASFLGSIISEGGCVACIVNTVARAQRIYRALGEGSPIRLREVVERVGIVMDPEVSIELGDLPVGKLVGDTEVYLFHARYPAEERQVREQLAMAMFGKNGVRPRAALLVATQVIEQSLDLDFDAMVTDLAPVDLVVQRAGRLHRHERQRPPGFGKARLFVAGLGEEPPDVDTEYWSKVYDRYVLLASWWVLRDRPSVSVPHQLEPLLEEVYAEQPIAGLVERLGNRATTAWNELQRLFRRNEDIARSVAIAEPEELLKEPATAGAYATGMLHLDDDEEDAETQLLLTRLGDPSVLAVPIFVVGGGTYLDPRGEEPATYEGKVPPELARRLFMRSVRLARHEVYGELVTRKPPKGWARHALVRRLRPLELARNEEGTWCWCAGGVRVVLDPELGVVYEGAPSR